MNSLLLPTEFAPAERLSAEAIERQNAEIKGMDRLRPLLDSIPMIVVLLNAQRQILIGNGACDDLARALGVESYRGMRPGELLACQHAVEAKYGCGTTEACRTCGAVNAILAAVGGQRATNECRIGDVNGTAYDLRVTASPLRWEGHDYVMLAIGNISDEKRRQVLERVFFQEVFDTAANISGLTRRVADEPLLFPDLKDELLFSAEMLVDEVNTQRILLAAEAGQLTPRFAMISGTQIIDRVQKLCHNDPSRAGQRIKVELNGVDFALSTDPTLLRRALANLLANALEAAPAGESVVLGMDAAPKDVVFWCWNAGAIPRDVSVQIFKRSFSTKGPNRGIGAYAAKLLAERYLHGKVSFTSTLERGTRFQICIPREQVPTAKN